MKKIEELSIVELERSLEAVLSEMYFREYGKEPKRFLITPTNCFIAFVTIVASFQVYWAFLS